MVNLVKQKVQEMLMPTEVIKQQRESCSIKESRCITTALQEKAVVKTCMSTKYVVILNSELATHSLVSDMGKKVCICTSFIDIS